eukprot:gene6315-8695_t
MDSKLSSVLSSPKSNKLWSFLSAKDVLNFSVCSKATAGALLDSATLQDIVNNEPKIKTIGQFELTFSSDLTSGLFRKVLYRILTTTKANVLIGNTNGRILLDLGSTLEGKDQYMAPSHVAYASTVTNVVQALLAPEDEDPGVDSGAHEIMRHLEVSSCDEYDDFNPRHPMPRDKAHRRGDSYFNSDVDLFTNDPILGGMSNDLSSIAALALDQNAGTTPASSLKNKFLAQKNKKALQAQKHLEVHQEAMLNLIKEDDDNEN